MDTNCAVENCNKKKFGRGLCSMHYKRLQRTGDLGSAQSTYTPNKICSVDDCSTKARGKGYCSKHYARFIRTGSPLLGARPAPKYKPFTVNGYVIEPGFKDHPNSDYKGRISQHIRIMSEMLGRPLVRGENVHHKNGVRDDNRPENLELWVVSQPAGQRPEDLVAWAHEILERYGNTAPQ